MFGRKKNSPAEAMDSKAKRASADPFREVIEYADNQRQLLAAKLSQGPLSEEEKKSWAR